MRASDHKGSPLQMRRLVSYRTGRRSIMALNQRERTSVPAKARVMQIPSRVPQIQSVSMRALLSIDVRVCTKFMKAMDRESCPLAMGSNARSDGCSRIVPNVATVASKIAANHSTNDGRQWKNG